MNEGDFYKLFYSRWSHVPRQRQEGYTILLMVPGDLPVFLKMAMEVCAAQKNGHLVETLVLPDSTSPRFFQAFEKYCAGWAHGAIRVIPFRRGEQFLASFLNNPGLNNWLQFVNGLNHCGSTYVLWHDADLFLFDERFFEKRYQICMERNLALLGVNKIWDPWYWENGYGYLVATWELMFSADWAMRFKPWEHRGHTGQIGGRFQDV